MAASEGFKNLGQFVAAANRVSQPRHPVRYQLKTSMVDDGASLGQSIQTLKKSANADLEAQRAVREANTMALRVGDGVPVEGAEVPDDEARDDESNAPRQ